MPQLRNPLEKKGAKLDQRREREKRNKKKKNTKLTFLATFS